MAKLSDEYYERNCYFKTETVPTQSVMRNRMCSSLANVYFKSMRPKLKVLAGLAPPMKGGGGDWFVPPEELLKGRTVMKPMRKEFLSKLGFNGIAHFGEKILADHKKQMKEYRAKKFIENDNFWKNTIETKCRAEMEECRLYASRLNTKKIEVAFHQFCNMYSTSLTKLEDILLNAAIQEIEQVKKDTIDKMQTRYELMLKKQATELYDHYNEKLRVEQARLKAEFINNLEEARTRLTNQIHDINVEKHVAIEKMRNLLECQNLACQVYVALKEREECKKETDEKQRKHTKEVKALAEQIALTDFEIHIAKEREQKRREFQKIWYKKVCEVVKKFQMFVSYSMNMLPEHAEFFINTEKLLLLQLNEVLEDPEAESIFEYDKADSFHTPIPRPHPFFLFCDKGYKPNIDQNLCPKHCTSSASQLPVIVVNKRCIYAACDNFEMFTDKVTQYVHGQRGDDEDFLDDHDYTLSVPIKCSSTDLIHQVQLESSLQQLLQHEWANVRNLPLLCCSCNVPYCFFSTSKKIAPKQSDPVPDMALVLTPKSPPSGNKITLRSVELEHEREPKWESYLEYVKSKKCKCSKTAKKHLEEHLPPYMRTMSKYDAPDLPHYEMCDLNVLKQLVRKAQGKRTPPPEPPKPEPTTRDVATQYSDMHFEHLCTCFSDEEVDKLLQNLLKESMIFDAEAAKAKCEVVTGSITPSYMQQATPSFVTKRAFSLKNLLDDSPELEEIFRKKDCNFD